MCAARITRSVPDLRGHTRTCRQAGSHRTFRSAFAIRFVGRGARRTILLPILALAPLFAQAPQEPSPQGIIRITVNLVQVDAVVTDSEGHQVTDLRPEDFEILQDGRPQVITNFSYVSVASPTGPKTHPKTLPAATSLPSIPPAPLRPGQVRRTIVVVVDDLHIKFEDTVYARRALRKFVAEDVQPGDLVAILRTSRGLGMLQQFTNDKRLLYAAIDRFHYYLGGPFGPWGLAEGRIQAPGELDPTRGLASKFRQEVTAAATFDALDYVVGGLRDVPGRKSVVLLSDMIPVPYGDENLMQERLREIVDLADRSSTVLYTIDTRGLPTLQLSAADDLTGLVGSSPSQVANLLMNRRAGYFESQGPMAYLANQTGGLFVDDTNDLAGGMQEIMDDLSGYYLIGYKPPADTFKAGKKGGGYHHIQVKVKVRGLHVRSRTGFYGVPEHQTQPVRRTRDAQLHAAVVSPFAASGIHVALAPQFLDHGYKESIARLWLHVDASDLTLQDAPGRNKNKVLDLLAVAFGDNGAAVDDLGRSLVGPFQPRELDSFRKYGVNYHMDVPIKDPGGYQLRVAVRDPISKRVGSASQFIEIPDLRRDRLTLSGIVLNPDTLGDKGPAMRRFQAGDRVNYELEVYNARRGKAGQVRNLENKVQILGGDGRLVSTQNPGAISPVPWNPRRLVMWGKFTISPGMMPGDYALQVTVTDKLAPRTHSVASQWIDLEITPTGGVKSNSQP